MKSSVLKRDLDTYILTRQEHLIMEAVWELDGATTREVYELVTRRYTVAYTTVLTFMRILQKKGILKRRRVGRTHHYSPVLTKEQAVKNQLHEVLLNYFENNPNRLVETVLETTMETG